MKIPTRFLLYSLIGGLLLQCGSRQKKEQAEALAEIALPKVFVSNYPLEYFLSRISGDEVEVISFYKQIEEPTAWEPGEEEINMLQQADLVLLNGASFEPWAMMLSLPQSKLVVTTSAVKDQLIEERQIMRHSHGPEGEHEHPVSAYTTWIDFKLSQVQARSVLEALKRLQPEQAATYEANFKSLNQQLIALDEKLLMASGPWQEERLAFSHPVYQYFQNAYGMKGPSFHWEPHISLNKENWNDFRHEQSHHPFKYMIWESQPLDETIEKLNSQGVESIIFNPCTMPPQQGDFISVMEANIQNLDDIKPAP